MGVRRAGGHAEVVRFAVGTGGGWVVAGRAERRLLSVRGQGSAASESVAVGRDRVVRLPEAAGARPVHGAMAEDASGPGREVPAHYDERAISVPGGEHLGGPRDTIARADGAGDRGEICQAGQRFPAIGCQEACGRAVPRVAPRPREQCRCSPAGSDASRPGESQAHREESGADPGDSVPQGRAAAGPGDEARRAGAAARAAQSEAFRRFEREATALGKG